MLDALLKSKFYSRSKSEIKLTKKRIEMIKRKRMAMEKFLRNDVADLLKNGLDSNAYSRVEQLYADQKLSSCYEFVEQSCSLILSHLSAIDKQRECPDECKEAISTLMFAAARFADMPELRELRSLFSERYGDFLEPYVNQEFVRNLKAEAPTEEIKLQMMQQIAMECGIKWDSKALEQSLCKPLPFVKVKDLYQYPNERKNESVKTHHQKELEKKVQETEKKQTEVAKKEKTIENRLPYKPRVEVEVGKKEEKHKDQTNGNDLPYKSRDGIETKKVKHGQGRSSPYWSSNSSSCSSDSTTSTEDSLSEDIPEERKVYGFRSMPPPYVITDLTKKSTSSDTTCGFIKEEEVAESKCKNDNLLQSASEDVKSEGRKFYGFRSMAPPYINSKATAGSNVKDNNNLQREEEPLNSSTKPVPRSMRIRRPLKPVTDSQSNNEIPKLSPKISNGETHDDRDEEKKMDKLLSHYSRKPTDSIAREAHAPTRTGSLPTESLAATEERKGLARATTYHADSSLSPQGHVHPKLPDYDDFVARLAALRANS